MIGTSFFHDLQTGPTPPRPVSSAARQLRGPVCSLARSFPAVALAPHARRSGFTGDCNTKDPKGCIGERCQHCGGHLLTLTLTLTLTLNK